MADSVDLGSVYATLDLRTQNFEQGIASASSSMGGLKQTILGVFGGNLLFSAVNSATRAMTGFAKSTISTAATFETSMNVLSAVTGATTSELELFRKKSIELGKDITLPAVSAADAATAMTEMAKAGLSMTDTLSGSKGVLQAAAAGNISVEESAKLVSSALLSFGLAGEESIRVADLLATAANASSLELGDVGLGLQQVGAQARLSGVPIEQTVGMLAQLANKGISAQQAGTALSYMLKQLTAPTKKSKELMQELGIQVYDASGQFVGMRKMIENLNVATKDMNQEQKAATLNVLFGAEAMKGASVIMADGVEGFDKMQASMSRTGSAAELAGARTKGLNGVMSAIGSQMETFALIIGEKIVPVLTKMGQYISDNLEDVFNSFMKTAENVVKSMVDIGEKVKNYLLPKIIALWNAFEDLLPTLKELYRTVLSPLASMLAGAFLVAVGLAIDVLKIIFNILKPLIDVATHFKDAIIFLTIAFTAFKIAIAIQGLLTAIGSGFIASTVATLGFKGALEALALSVNPVMVVLTLLAAAFAALNWALTDNINSQIKLMEAESARSEAAAQAAATQFQEVMQAYKDIATQAERYLSITKQLKSAEEDVKVSTEKLTEAVRLYGAGSQQALDAAAELAGAEARLKQTQLERKAEVDKLIASTERLTEIGGPLWQTSRDQIDADLAGAKAVQAQMKARQEDTAAIDEVIYTLEELIKIKDVEVTTGVRDVDAKSKLKELNDILNNTPKSLNTTATVFFKSDTSAFKLPEVWKGVPYKLPGNAQGTNNWRGGMTWVGEQGPELVNLPKGSQVIPNHKLNNVNQTNPISIYGDINIANQQDADYLLQRLSRRQDLTTQGLVGA